MILLLMAPVLALKEALPLLSVTPALDELALLTALALDWALLLWNPMAQAIEEPSLLHPQIQRLMVLLMAVSASSLPQPGAAELPIRQKELYNT